MATLPTIAAFGSCLSPSAISPASMKQHVAASSLQLNGSRLQSAVAAFHTPTRSTVLRGTARDAAVTPQELDQKLDVLIQEAKDLCATGTAGECAAMWDAIEEISAEASHKKARARDEADPLEKYCDDNPETDECRTYEF